MEKEPKLSVGDTEILLTCHAIEKECAQIYWYFAQLFADDPKFKKLWQKTAIEEDGHAEQCMLAYHLRGSGMKNITIDAQRAKFVMGKVRAIHGAVHRTPPSLKDALRLAIMMEENLACCHMDIMVVFAEPKLQKMFASMKKVENQHVEMLQRAYDAVTRGK